MSRAYKMKSYLPGYYDDAKQVKAILEAEGIEFDRIAYDIYDILDQFFIETATWGLELWENEFDVKAKSSETYEQRRARLKSKISGSGTFTQADSETLANQFSEPKDAKHVRRTGTYTFKTSHNVDHIIDFDEMISAFAEVKPAHLQHIKGLLIRENFQPATKKFLNIYLIYKQAMGPNTKKYEHINVNSGFAGTSEYNDATWSPYSTLNGSWELDGNWLGANWLLDGENPLGADNYHIQSDVLTLRIYKDGVLQSTETLSEKV